jgi:hypothetical protein
MPHIDASSPTTQTQPRRRRFDPAKWTAVDIQKPCALLMDCGTNLVALISRHHHVSPHGELLHALRLVTIPNGFRLRLVELRASIGTAHLPDEWLYMKAIIRPRAGMVRLIIDGETRASRSDAFPVQPLTASQYQTLVTCSGRLLRAQLVAMFANWLPNAVVAHRPWMLPSPPGSETFGRTRYAG